MKVYKKKFEIRWADLDPNYHVLHSKYYDFGAYCRMSCFNDYGLTPELMLEHNLGPILLMEQCRFKKEILFGDEMEITFILHKHTENFSRWSISHEIFRNNVLAAEIEVEGAWIDTVKRKFAFPAQAIIDIFNKIKQLPEA